MSAESTRRGRSLTALSRLGLLVWIAAGLVLLAGAARNLFTTPGSTLAAGSRMLGGRASIPAAERRYVPAYELRSGEEVMLVLVGGSFCGAHRKPGFAQAVEDAKVRLQDQAKARGWQFRAVGVSLDWEPAEALEFLAAFGGFDEVSAGGNWVNASAFRYVWRDLPGDPVVPQMIVVRRRLEAGGRAIRVADERVVRRIRGSDDIMAWVRSGAEL